MSLEVGAIVEGEVTGITNFGAFVQLPEGKVGLIHISEVSNVYVKDVHDFLKEKDKVKVKVLSIDERGKIGLSIKQLTPPPPAPPKPQRPVSQERRAPKVAPPVSFEDKLSRFLKDSDDRLLDLKRNTESKRGGRGASRHVLVFFLVKLLFTLGIRYIRSVLICIAEYTTLHLCTLLFCHLNHLVQVCALATYCYSE